jgi:hypothetical protein
VKELKTKAYWLGLVERSEKKLFTNEEIKTKEKVRCLQLLVIGDK